MERENLEWGKEEKTGSRKYTEDCTLGEGRKVSQEKKKREGMCKIQHSGFGDAETEAGSHGLLAGQEVRIRKMVWREKGARSNQIRGWNAVNEWTLQRRLTTWVAVIESMTPSFFAMAHPGSWCGFSALIGLCCLRHSAIPAGWRCEQWGAFPPDEADPTSCLQAGTTLSRLGELTGLAGANSLTVLTPASFICMGKMEMEW